MDVGSLALVLAAALLHAAWNALIKSGKDPVLDTALVALSGTVVALPLAAFVPPPAPADREALQRIATLYEIEKCIRGHGADERRDVR